MRTFILCGSHQKDSQSLKVSKIIAKRIESETGAADILDLGQHPLPLWDESFWKSTPEWKQKWDPIAQKLALADSLVIVAPEYGGMVPAAVKNFFLFCGGTDLMAHKPALLVGVSAGINGAYPISELRMSGYKNCRPVYIPDHVIVRNAAQFTTAGDEYTQKRLDYGVATLKVYAQALKQVRESGVIDLKSFPFAM